MSIELVKPAAPNGGILERSRNICERTARLYERLESLRDRLRGVEENPAHNETSNPAALVAMIETTQRYVDLTERMLTDIEEMF